MMSTVLAEVDRVHIDQAAEVPSSKLLRGIKGIIFDFDGTLFDNAWFGFNLIAANPLDIIRIRYDRIIRKRFAGRDFSSSDSYYRAFFAEMGKACWCSAERMQNWYFNRYMPRMIRLLKKHYQLRPRAQELFRFFEDSNSLRVAVYSDYPFLRERLEILGIYSSPRILLYGPESFGAQKPAVRPFLRIAADLGVAAEEMLVVGDREDTDGFGAFRAGMRFFYLETSRKHFFSLLDPNRLRPRKEPQGPSLVMYAGAWDDLVKLLLSSR
jgi:FMN phosphatase YigB (HAD superfamily)